jgi:hypothetical protein
VGATDVAVARQDAGSSHPDPGRRFGGSGLARSIVIADAYLEATASELYPQVGEGEDGPRHSFVRATATCPFS